MAVHLDGAGRSASCLLPRIMCAYQKILQISCSITFLVMRCVHFSLSLCGCVGVLVCSCVVVRTSVHFFFSFGIRAVYHIVSLPPYLSSLSTSLCSRSPSARVCVSLCVSVYIRYVCCPCVCHSSGPKMPHT